MISKEQFFSSKVALDVNKTVKPHHFCTLTLRSHPFFLSPRADPLVLHLDPDSLELLSPGAATRTEPKGGISNLCDRTELDHRGKRIAWFVFVRWFSQTSPKWFVCLYSLNFLSVVMGTVTQRMKLGEVSYNSISADSDISAKSPMETTRTVYKTWERVKQMIGWCVGHQLVASYHWRRLKMYRSLLLSHC